MNYLIKRATFGFALELKKALPRRLIDRQKTRPKFITPEDKRI